MLVVPSFLPSSFLKAEAIAASRVVPTDAATPESNEYPKISLVEVSFADPSSSSDSNAHKEVTGPRLARYDGEVPVVVGVAINAYA